MTTAKGWKLYLRTGDIDQGLSILFGESPLSGEVDSVHGVETPELHNSEGEVVARGVEEVKNLLRLAHQSEHWC